MNKHLIAIGVVIILIAVGLSGCTDEITNEINSKTVDITGSYITQTVHDTESPIIIDIVGSYCEITVTEETNLIEIDITGSYNTISVSKSHSYSSDITGIDNEIVYYD